MNYLKAIELAALKATEHGRPVYVSREGGEFVLALRFPTGFACVRVDPGGSTREIDGAGSRSVGLRAGVWTGD